MHTLISNMKNIRSKVTSQFFKNLINQYSGKEHVENAFKIIFKTAGVVLSNIKTRWINNLGKKNIGYTGMKMGKYARKTLDEYKFSTAYFMRLSKVTPKE